MRACAFAGGRNKKLTFNTAHAVTTKKALENNWRPLILLLLALRGNAFARAPVRLRKGDGGREKVLFALCVCVCGSSIRTDRWTGTGTDTDRHTDTQAHTPHLQISATARAMVDGSCAIAFPKKPTPHAAMPTNMTAAAAAAVDTRQRFMVRENTSSTMAIGSDRADS